MKILDLSAGNRAVWFNKKNKEATYIDIREDVFPDVVCDSRELPRSITTAGPYDLVLFDPPHMNYGPNSNMSKVYGHFNTEYILDLIQKTAKQAWIVTRSEALMALKWNDHDIKLQRVFELMPMWEPLFGHLTKDGPGSKTYWAMLKRKDNS